MKPRRIALAGTGGVAALASALALAPGAVADPPALAAATCTPVSNIEAIIDDSGSMSFSDADKLRVSALNLLIDTPGNEQITLGAVEFGGQIGFAGEPPAADTVFAPQPIGPNAAAMKAALQTRIDADNGITDYNAAFDRARTDNPNAKARIFLTDGAHNVGTYNNGHQGGPPTYVIGFSAATTGVDGQRLQQIASDTGGRYFAQTDSSNLQGVMNEIGTTLTCQSPPKTFRDAFARAGQSKRHAVSIASRAKSAQLTLSWTSPLDQFTIGQVQIVKRGRVVAVASARKRRLRLTTRRGATFLVVKVGNLTRGKLRFKVRATRIGSGAPSVSLTTQVTQSRRR
ncbi:MAG TPA: vWA domain-containing protein [Gemmatimonadaceae bacterium]|nr:vWA domain-containing protein [Gemmatimonadaceae bacterium]